MNDDGEERAGIFEEGPRAALIRRSSRSPQHLVPRDDEARLLQLACLTVGARTPGGTQDAARNLRESPHLAMSSWPVAVAIGDEAAVAAHLDADPTAAVRTDGPFAWAPLLYLTYSRLRPAVLPAGGPSDPVGVARLLLAYGADPDAGFLWDGLPSPFTALTGVFGGGEHGTPPHADELALARLLLRAGADPNDHQTIYDRGLAEAIPQDDTMFLALLLDAGLGRGDGGPWQRALGDLLPAPIALLAEALHHAARAGLPRRARLLLDHGADPELPSSHPLHDGLSPVRSAVRHGNPEIARMLIDAGAATDAVTAQDRLDGAWLSADAGAVDRGSPSGAELVGNRSTQQLVITAAVLDRPEAIRLLHARGADLDTASVDGATALHEAAVRGNLPLVELLLSRGADPTLRDVSHRATAAQWARHAGHDSLAVALSAHEG